MADDDDSSNNPFVRFKNSVDSNIRSGFQSVFGPPSSNPMQPTVRDTTDAHTPQRGTSSSDTGDNTQAYDVLTWAAYSPYSPLNLQHLPQPRRRDAPEWYDGFTFRDAFEELLAESSGQPLFRPTAALSSSILGQLAQFPRGEPVEDWVAKLGRQGLWDAYFPLSSSARRDLAQGPTSPWRSGLAFQSPMLSPPVRDKALSEVPFGHILAEVLGVLEDSMKSDTPEARRVREQEEQGGTEEDFYEFLKSNAAAARAQAQAEARERNSTPAYGNAVQVTDPTMQTTVSQDPETGTVTETTWYQGGAKVQKTIQNNSNGGKTDIKTTTRWYDEEGNVVAQNEETSTRRSWSSNGPGEDSWFKASGSIATTKKTGRSFSDYDDDSSSSSEQKDGKRDGWFWSK